MNAKVFQQESKHPSMVLTVKKREEFEKVRSFLLHPRILSFGGI